MVQPKNTRSLHRMLVWSIFGVNCATLSLPVITAAQYSPARLPELTQSTVPLANTAGTPSATNGTQPVNSLRIPSLRLEVPIQEGPTIVAANYGAWRRPASATPAGPGNIVLAGHRTSPTSAVFRYLPTISEGDQIELIWEGLRYQYTVIETFTVPEDATWIEDQSGANRLTLYTCTPLLASTHRFVVVAYPL